jgi:N-carbamoyl-L-amino-acid hydrolase
VRAECKAIERERGVRFEFDRRLLSEPATMDESIWGVSGFLCVRRFGC